MRAGGKDLHQLAFGGGQADTLFALPHLAPVHVIPDVPQMQHLGRGLALRGFGHPAQDGVDPQKQFFGFERFGQVVIRSGLQPVNAVAGFALGRQHQDRGRSRFAQGAGQADAVFAGHHHVQNDQVEIQPRQHPPRMFGIARRRDQKAMAHQELLEQIADAFVVIDNQQMCVRCCHCPFSRSLTDMRRRSASIIASSTLRKPATASGPASR